MACPAPGLYTGMLERPSISSELERTPSIIPTPSEKDANADAARHDLISLPRELSHLSHEDLRKLEKRLVRKIDIRLIPMMTLLLLLNLLDRGSIASAQIAGLSTDLAISNNQYNTSIMVFYIGYMTTQLPSNMLLGKVRPSWYLPAGAIGWGVITLCQGFIKNYGGLLATRILLGVVQGPFFPGTSFLTTCWYKKNELPQRTAYLYAGNILSLAFGGLIGAGILGSLDGAAGLAAWRWLFIIYGAITVFIGILAIYVFPDYPKTTKWLTDDERIFAEWRLENELAGVKDDEWGGGYWWGVKESLKDPLTYLFTFMGMNMCTAGAFVSFLPSIMKVMLYGTELNIPKDNTRTLLLTAPPYFVAFVGSLIVAHSTAKRGERCIHTCVPMLISLAGSIMLSALIGSFAARYVSVFLMVFGIYAIYAVPIPWIASSIPRPRSKRAAALAIINFVSSGITYFYNSYLFPDSSAPKYVLGSVVVSVSIVSSIVGAVSVRAYLQVLNRRLESEGKEFRYVL